MVLANLSGGRDSTAMVVKWLEMGERLDYILFCDLGFEFKEMYEYIDKLDDYLNRKFNTKITRLDCRDVFEKWAFEKPISRGVKMGGLRGLPKEVGLDYCTREGKTKPSRNFCIDKGSRNKWQNTVLIGYTAQEVKNGRTTSLDYAVTRYPLAELGWNEQECEDFLAERSIANPLYKHFKRTGCFFCPHQNKQSLYNLWKHYPKEWEISKGLEDKAQQLGCENQTFKIGKSLREFEAEFKLTPTFDFNDLKVEENYCFCK